MPIILQEILSYVRAAPSASLRLLGCALLGLFLAAWLTKPTCPEGAFPALTAALVPSASWLPAARWTCYAPASQPAARTLPAVL